MEVVRVYLLVHLSHNRYQYQAVLKDNKLNNIVPLTAQRLHSINDSLRYVLLGTLDTFIR